jgi:hypothetical protein
MQRVDLLNVLYLNLSKVISGNAMNLDKLIFSTVDYIMTSPYYIEIGIATEWRVTLRS